MQTDVSRACMNDLLLGGGDEGDAFGGAVRGNVCLRVPLGPRAGGVELADNGVLRRGRVGGMR